MTLDNFVSFITKNLLWILLIFITTEFAIPFSAEYALKGLDFLNSATREDSYFKANALNF